MEFLQSIKYFFVIVFKEDGIWTSAWLWNTVSLTSGLVSMHTFHMITLLCTDCTCTDFRVLDINVFLDQHSETCISQLRF